MKTFFAFLISRVFWINLLIAAFVVLAIVFGSLHYLKSYSMHGDTITVPDFSNIPIGELDGMIKNHELRYLIVDSVYSDAHDRGVVVNQNPDPKAEVKKNRKVYLTVNATLPPMVTMRDMVGLSKRQAVSMLQAMGLEVDSLVYQPDICVDCVLDQRHKSAHIPAGTKLQKGEKVTLVLGSGREGRVVVPRLTGLTYAEATEIIHLNSLTRGTVILCDGCETSEDSVRAVVYRQIPMFREDGRSVIPMGSSVDLYLTTDTSAINIQQPDTTLIP